MAEGSPVQNLCEETSCPICLEYFKEPVTIDCGHNFCQACLIRCWGYPEKDASCPQCRELCQQRNFKPNRQLGNIVEIAKQFSLQVGKGAEAQSRVCKRHQEPLKFFCEDDQAPICLVCDRSKEHREHKVIPKEEAFEEYKEQIEANLKSMEERRNHLANWILSENHESEECLKQLEIVNQKISSVFDEMQNFLKEKKDLWLGQLQDLESSIKERQERNVSKLSEGILDLSNLITEMNGNLQQPADEFLQDIKNTLKRSQKKQLEHTLYFIPGLEERLISFSQKASNLEMAMKKHKGSLEWALTKAWSPKQVVNKVNVAMDPDTANAFLVLSKNLKNVLCGEEEQNLPNVPERFDWEPCVLGHDRFTSGNPWWEVMVKKEGEMWALGVARETIRRKRCFIPSPSEGIWAIGKPSGGSFSSYELWAFTSPKPTLLTLKRNPRKILVSLLYEEGCVEFFDADSEKLIFTFLSVSFSGEIIRPFFWVAPGVWLKC